MTRVLRALVCLALALTALTALAAPAPARALARAGGDAVRATGPFRSGHGITVESAEQISPREWRLVVSTTALQRPVRVDVLLPAGYDRSARRYPSLYLFHGTSGGAHDWIELGDAAASTAKLPMIVVMPDAGYDGDGGSWFTDWVDQATPLGRARWETFHIEQLVPWIDATLRTRESRGSRAVAGLSQGGFGSFSYAARHPDLFVAAASFSGAPDIAAAPATRVGGSLVVSAIMTGLNQVQPFAPFGDPVADRMVWRGHNPASLVGNLADTDLRLWTGSGAPGTPDDLSAVPAGVAIEAITHLSTLHFADAADRAGVPYELTDYGPGVHSWPYWTQDLRDYLPHLTSVLAQRRGRPAEIDYRSVDRTWRQWGWRVAATRSAELAWSGLRDASRTGFVLDGGPARVTTPPWYEPGRAYRVGHVGGAGPSRAVAGRDGRLRLDVGGAGPVRVTIGRAGGR